MLQAGEQIGPYTLVRQLGRGAFGLVWLAERRGAFATTQVALKLALDDEPNLAALAQESQLWAKLGVHNNVLPIIEADKYGDYMVLVSEYAPDGSLDGWLKKHKGAAPSLESAIAMTIGILNGLEHLHSKKIIHRDLKPANILLQNETPRLADFGLARVLKSTMQSTGVAGTPAYMAPEVFSGERFVQSDLWSVGVILYQLLSGRLPFPQTDVMALLGAIVHRNPDPLPNYVPSELVQIIAYALQKNINKRFQSASEMRNALQQVISKGNITLTNAQLEDDRPTAILNTLPGIDLSGMGQVLETLPALSKNANNQQTQIINENTVEQIKVFNTYKQAESSTTNFKPLPKVKVATAKGLKISLPKKNSHRMYETLAVSVVMVVMLSATFLKASNYNGVGVSIKDDKAYTVKNVDSETELLDEYSVRHDLIVLDEESDKARNNNEELIKEIQEKSSMLEEYMRKVSENNKKNIEKQYLNIQEKLADESLNIFNPNSTALYRAYLMNLDTLIIAAKSYLGNSSPSPISKKLDKARIEEKNILDKTARFIEKRISFLPESKEKKEIRETCSNVRSNLDRIAYVYSSDYQNYKANLEKLARQVEEMKLKDPKVAVVDEVAKTNSSSFVFTNKPPKPPKPAPKKPLIESNALGLEFTIPFSLAETQIDAEALKQLMLIKDKSNIQVSKEGLIIKLDKALAEKAFADKKRQEAFRKLKTDRKIPLNQAQEN
ncbi:MAG: protein kinase [Acidobacteria bacterium]|nr:protein kinase [Acidobacteriota bacterium]